jgi:RNA polymerase sigma factor (sigma-70 family)
MKENGNNTEQNYQAVLEAIVQFYMGLVNSWAKKIIKKTRWVTLQDLKQEGIIAILHAIKDFDPNRELELSSFFTEEFRNFVTSRIRTTICAYPRKAHDISEYKYKHYRRFQRAHDDLMRQLERTPTVEEIAEEAGLTSKQVEEARGAVHIGFAEELSDEVQGKLVIDAGCEYTLILINELLTHLTEREQTILGAYYFQELPDKESAINLGLKPDTVKKTRQRALHKLKKFLK